MIIFRACAKSVYDLFYNLYTNYVTGQSTRCVINGRRPSVMPR